ncbi:hypothetical protein GOV11_04085 [Candidatus Woesearchaeota archaeon]|nr:hypothetical protein [Candidatus Woesearchaeota archaeon]
MIIPPIHLTEKEKKEILEELLGKKAEEPTTEEPNNTLDEKTEEPTKEEYSPEPYDAVIRGLIDLPTLRKKYDEGKLDKYVKKHLEPLINIKKYKK